ncbi:SDR family NAD(P)-dependent oxidoreductase [Patescibacteria group bacterium]
MEIKNKTILVVGASGGIGNKTSEILLGQGYKVIGTYYKDKPNIENLTNHENFESKELDVSNKESIKKFRQSLNESLYAVINCSGIVEFEGEGLDKDFDIWDRTIATNLSGNYYLAKVFFDDIEQNGRFIMISSTDSYYGGSVTAAYAASKMGVNSLTKSLSLLFKDRKILVNTIAPGWVLTKMTEGEGKEFLDKVAEMNPLGRIGQPNDIAKVIKFLLSEDSNYLNGQVISVEGGYTNQDPTLLLEEDVVS